MLCLLVACFVTSVVARLPWIAADCGVMLVLDRFLKLWRNELVSVTAVGAGAGGGGGGAAAAAAAAC